ncbi:MAG: hypothetical protein Q9222_002897 [Ikaeria aurantiellina]
MLAVLIYTILAIPISYILHSCWCLYRNIQTAKSTGLAYVILPWNSLNIIWLIARPILLPYLIRLPVRDRLWFRLLNVDWPWQEQYSPFQTLGSDNFFSVSPARNYFHTADAAVIDQITKRRNDFPKPVEVYGSLDLYGKNVVSTEGPLWKHHRKTVSPPFNEKNNRLVWAESLRQAQGMVKGWMGGRAGSSPDLLCVAADCMKLSLHVISCAGFGVNLEWPGTDDGQNGHLGNGHLSPPPAEKGPKEPLFKGDHQMSYTDALSNLLHNMLWILVLPMYLLSE